MDIIIEQMEMLEILWPLLKIKGLYIIEDVDAQRGGLTFVSDMELLSPSFSNTPHTGCNDAAPEVVQALTAEQGYAQHQFKSCGDIAAAGGCAMLESSAYSETCCASCASAGGPTKSTYAWSKASYQ